MSAAIFVAVLVLVVLLSTVFDDGVPPTYRGRSCQGKNWRRSFPKRSKQSIREFLSLFTDSFAIKSGRGLSFQPDDELMAIYRARYPRLGWSDVLELETFARDLEKRHNLRLEDIWHEHITLGQVFSQLPAPNKALQRTRSKQRASER